MRTIVMLMNCSVNGTRKAQLFSLPNPNLGALEPLLKQHTKQYHSIVATQYNKIIYLVNDDHIEIVAFWDVRREPAKLANEIIDK